MIQSRLSTENGRTLLVLGLSRNNMKLLLAGNALKVDGEAIGVTNDVLILGGETELDIHATMMKVWGSPEDKSKFYTCCEEHAAQAGVPHNPQPGRPCPPNPPPPDPAGLPDV